MSLTLPDGKIVYNLPEQVAKNADDIKKIAAILDGLNIQDNLVVIADISQILTRSELDVVERPVAFLYYSDQLYIKKNEVGGSAFFDVIFTITGSTVLSFSSKEIEVSLATGALTLTTSTVSTYSKTELDTLLVSKADITYVDSQLALKADLSGANFTGAITSPSIIENMSGYTFISETTDAEQTPIYIGVAKTGNKITFVYFFSFVGKDFSGISNPELGRINLPASVGAKLIPFTIGGSNNILDLKTFSIVSTDWQYKEIHMGLVKKYDTQIQFKGYDWATLGLTIGKTYLVRYEATFLLSDSLA